MFVQLERAGPGVRRLRPERKLYGATRPSYDATLPLREDLGASLDLDLFLLAAAPQFAFISQQEAVGLRSQCQERRVGRSKRRKIVTIHLHDSDQLLLQANSSEFLLGEPPKVLQPFAVPTQA